jgi:hypothetical protein
MKPPAVGVKPLRAPAMLLLAAGAHGGVGQAGRGGARLGVSRHKTRLHVSRQLLLLLLLPPLGGRQWQA